MRIPITQQACLWFRAISWRFRWYIFCRLIPWKRRYIILLHNALNESRSFAGNKMLDSQRACIHYFLDWGIWTATQEILDNWRPVNTLRNANIILFSVYCLLNECNIQCFRLALLTFAFNKMLCLLLRSFIRHFVYLHRHLFRPDSDYINIYFILA